MSVTFVVAENAVCMSHGTLVSVLQPVYNSEPYLQESISSILNQTFKDFELLIIDDGSTDSSNSIISANQSRDSRIRVLRHEKNLGLVAALNLGLQHAKGEFIARMDSDDISLPERLASQVSFLRDNPSVSIVGTAVEVFTDPQSSTKAASTATAPSPASEAKAAPRAQPPKVIRHPPAPGMVHWSMFFYCALAHPTVMARRSVFEGQRYSDDFPRCEDYDLWMRLLPAHRMANLNTVLLRLRKHGANLSSTGRVSQREQSLFIVQQRLRALGFLSAPASSPAPVESAPSDAKQSSSAASAVVEPAVAALVYPSQATSLAHLAAAFDILKKLEQFVLAHALTASDEKALIQKDATSRMGEIVVAAMKLDAGGATGLWRQWMARDPKLALSALLGAKPKGPAAPAAKSAAAAPPSAPASSDAKSTSTS